jgi:hypothetical protein
MNAKRTTDDLIRDLAALPVPAGWSPAATLSVMTAAAAATLALFWVIFGLRADLAEAVQRVPVQAKTILPIALAVLAAGTAFASARPGRRVMLWALLVPLGFGAILVCLRIVEGSEAFLMTELVGNTAMACIASITLMAMLPLGLGLLMLRRAAPTRPELTGALIGLAAGAGIAAGYALHCTEDSPLFFMTWYGLAISTVTIVGAFLGRHLLRW